MKIEWEDNELTDCELTDCELTDCELTDCVLVDKDGYFNKMKVPKEMLEKYPDMVIGLTTNKVFKIKLPLDHDSSGCTTCDTWRREIRDKKEDKV